MHVMVAEIELLVAGLDFIEELGNGDHVPLRIVACTAGQNKIPFGIALDERPRDDVIEFSFPVFEGLTAAKAGTGGPAVMLEGFPERQKLIRLRIFSKFAD